MTQQDELFRAAYNAAAVVFGQHDDKHYAVPFALDKAREATAALAESVVMAAVDAARRDAPDKQKVNPLTTCPLCLGVAVSFAYQSAWCGACESCKQAWRCRTSKVAIPKTSLTAQREIEQKLDGYMWLDQVYDAP